MKTEKCNHDEFRVILHKENSYPTLRCQKCGDTWSSGERAMWALHKYCKKFKKLKDGEKKRMLVKQPFKLW